MTHEQYVTFETARLAKQAGFVWKVRGYYDEDDTLSATPIEYDHNSAGYVSAPTQAVLQRWLREVKQFYIGMGRDYHGMWVCFIHCGCIYYSVRETICKHTYEQALEAGLQKCLTLIIEN